MQIFDVYGEDGDFAYYNASTANGIFIATAPNYPATFRSAANAAANYARCAIGAAGGTGYMARLWPSGPQQTAWLGCRIFVPWFVNFAYQTVFFFGLTDANGVLRIGFAYNNSGTTFQVVKISAAGSVTSLGNSISAFSQANSWTSGGPDQLSVNFDYASTGFLTVYINGAQVFTYSGDITTDGMTALGGTYHGAGTVQSNAPILYSECVLSDSDTRDMSVFTLVPNAPGTADQWTGQVSNVDEITVNDGIYDTTSTSGAIQRYLMSAIPTGNYEILAKASHIRATQGSGSLTHIALAELLNGTANVTAPVAFPTAFGPVQFLETVNPVTGVAWTQADLTNVAREAGYQATA